MNIIYADTLFALSVFTDYLLLVVTARFCSLRLRRWRYLAAAALGGVYAVAVFLPDMAWLAHPLCELCAAGFMGLIAFGVRKSFSAAVRPSWRCRQVSAAPPGRCACGFPAGMRLICGC